MKLQSLLQSLVVLLVTLCIVSDISATRCEKPPKPSEVIAPSQKGLNERSVDNQETPFLEQLNELLEKYEPKFSNEKPAIKDSIEQFFKTLQSVAQSDNHIKNLKGRVRGMHKWIQEQFSVSDITPAHQNDWKMFLDQLAMLGK